MDSAKLTWYRISVFVRVLSYEGILDMTSTNAVGTEQNQGTPLEGRIANWETKRNPQKC